MSAEAAFDPTLARERAEPSSLGWRQTKGRIAAALLAAATGLAVVILAVLLWSIWSDGRPWLSWGLIRNFPSRKPAQAGMQPAIWGTLWVVGVTALLAFPVGVGSAVYLEEYADRRNRWTGLIQTNIANLAGVPSIVYGLLGLGLFVEAMRLGRSVLAGGLTMALLILPVVIIAAQEAIRAVPPSLREAAYGVGATKWQVSRDHVLPAAMPGILTGVILALSRAIGETAPLLVVGASAYVTFNPTGPMSGYTVVPMQIYEWARRPQADFSALAAAAIVVLMVMLLAMNGLAIFLRQRASAKARW